MVVVFSLGAQISMVAITMRMPDVTMVLAHSPAAHLRMHAITMRMPDVMMVVVCLVAA